jgi:hypothetical protein
MTADEYRTEIGALILKPPKPESIQTVQAVRQFKDLAKKAGSIKGKSLAALQTLFNQLRSYY